MAKKSTKEKKLLRKKKLEESLKRDDIKFNIFQLLNSEPLLTKPDVGEFLKKFVKEIRILNSNSKVFVYPFFDFSASKIMIDFVDGHQILVSINSDSFTTTLWFSVTEVEMTESQQTRMCDLIRTLCKFGFLGKFSNSDAICPKNTK